MSGIAKAFLKPFIGGMNTEMPQTDDMVQFTMDELNCTILPEGIRGRRYGMDIERGGTWIKDEQNRFHTYAGFFWKNVGKTPLDILVYQSGRWLRFYRAQKPFSIGQYMDKIDLYMFITDKNRFSQYPVKFAIGDGKLMVVSKYMKTIQISYNFATDKFNLEVVKIKYRDLEGTEDNLDIDEMPGVLSPQHKYNLLNQGWNPTDIDKVHSDKSKYPANNMQWFIGKDNSGIFNTEELLKTYFGNTPAPKGHYILDYFNRDRATASGVYAGTERRADYYYSGWRVSDRMIKGVCCNEFDRVMPSSTGTGKTVEVNLKQVLGKIAKKAHGPWRGKAIVILSGLLENNDWLELYRETFDVNGATVLRMVTNNERMFSQYKVTVAFIQAQNTMPDLPNPIQLSASVGLSIAEDGDPFQYTSSLDRVTDVAAMSGKYFYLTGDTVLFSQTVTEENKGFDKCYQDADPTSEEISDVLPTDGGYVKFQTMGDGLALKTFNRGVLVFGRDVVYGLLSPLEGRFTANEYDVVQLANAGLSGAESVVSTSDFVYYWSPLGIFRIGMSAQTGNTVVAESITQATIQSYYNNIPDWSKEHCKSAFDYANNRIYWFYPTNDKEFDKLDGVLVLDLNYNAFYPFKISGDCAVTALFDTVNSYEITPCTHLVAGGKRVVATIGDSKKEVIANEQNRKYSRFSAIQHCIKKPGQVWDELSFGDFNSRDFKDWGTEPYDSYMVTRPITMNDTYNNKQVPILQTLFKRTEEYRMTNGGYIAASGAMIRMRWGWGLTDRSNRWDLVQNGYRPQKDFLHDEFVESRIHVRGRGKAFQLEIRNDHNKDFKLSGVNLIIRGK